MQRRSPAKSKSRLKKKASDTAEPNPDAEGVATQEDLDFIEKGSDDEDDHDRVKVDWTGAHCTRDRKVLAPCVLLQLARR